MDFTSPAFADGATMPRRYTADGEDASPPLAWSDGPAGTVSFALVCDDPDAPSGTFTHWLAWNLEADRLELREGLPRAGIMNGVVQGENSFGLIGWAGPSPPRGKPHRYVFRLFALDDKLELPAGARRDELAHAIEGHVLADTTLLAMYGR